MPRGGGLRSPLAFLPRAILIHLQLYNGLFLGRCGRHFFVVRLFFFFSSLCLSLLISVARFVFHDNFTFLRPADGFRRIFMPEPHFRQVEPLANPAHKYIRKKIFNIFPCHISIIPPHRVTISVGRSGRISPPLRGFHFYRGCGSFNNGMCYVVISGSAAAAASNIFLMRSS